MPRTRPPVALFVTCLVDFFRPSVGLAAIALLEKAGFRVQVPDHQTCCGQPAFNSGDTATARQMARQVINLFEGYDRVVVPSGSCAGMMKVHYPRLFRGDPVMESRATSFSGKVFELVTFLAEAGAAGIVSAAHRQAVTYHDSCSGLRELGIKNQPRQLLGRVKGLALREMKEAEVCCGFGGTFCTKFRDISRHMAGSKVASILETGADTVLGGDLGCLLNIASALQGSGTPVNVRHIAEVLSGAADTLPPIQTVAVRRR